MRKLALMALAQRIGLLVLMSLCKSLFCWMYSSLCELSWCHHITINCRNLTINTHTSRCFWAANFNKTVRILILSLTRSLGFFFFVFPFWCSWKIQSLVKERSHQITLALTHSLLVFKSWIFLVRAFSLAHMHWLLIWIWYHIALTSCLMWNSTSTSTMNCYLIWCIYSLT